MVTAIVIPILCLYFYWITRKEMRAQDSKWRATGQVVQEAMVTGEIRSISFEKQKFYYHRYIYVQEFKVQTESKLITVKKEIAYTKNMFIEPYTPGEIIRAYGQWKDQQFYCGMIEKLKTKKGGR
ncbi:MAG: hypothetical protein Q8934_13915 [Bacillota bacterium]|nr:hypothetical protein [Bacillota bacterium]